MKILFIVTLHSSSYCGIEPIVWVTWEERVRTKYYAFDDLTVDFSLHNGPYAIIIAHFKGNFKSLSYSSNLPSSKS